MISMQCFWDKLGILSSSRTTETTEFLQQELGWLKHWNCSPLVARSHCVLCVFLFPVVRRRSQLWKTRRTKCSGRRSSGTRHAPSRQNPAWRHIATWRRRGRQRNSECCGSLPTWAQTKLHKKKKIKKWCVDWILQKSLVRETAYSLLRLASFLKAEAPPMFLYS